MSTINLLGCSTSVALTMGPTDEEEEEEVVVVHFQSLSIHLLKDADKIRIMKANEMHYFSYLFDKVLHIFRTGPLPIIRIISTLYTPNRYLLR